METRTITIGSKTFTVKELLGIEIDTIDFNNSKDALKKQIILSTGMTEDEYNQLTVKERLSLIKTISELNNPDFH